jgi:hypothetical protein
LTPITLQADPRENRRTRDPRLSIPTPKFAGKRGFEQFSVGCGEGYLIRERRIAPGRKPVGRIATKQLGLLQIDILSPCFAQPQAAGTTLNFLSSPGTKAVRDRSAGTGSREESVQISAAGHAKSGDLSSIVDPKGSEQM